MLGRGAPRSSTKPHPSTELNGIRVMSSAILCVQLKLLIYCIIDKSVWLLRGPMVTMAKIIHNVRTTSIMLSRSTFHAALYGCKCTWEWNKIALWAQASKGLGKGGHSQVQYEAIEHSLSTPLVYQLLGEGNLDINSHQSCCTHWLTAYQQLQSFFLLHQIVSRGCLFSSDY